MKNIFKKIPIIFFFTFFTLLFALFLIRLILPTQIDDISPQIPCEESLIQKSDIFYVIPKFNNPSIAENKTWCYYILSLNKTLALHGVYHTYNEFETPRTEEYLQEGIKIFEDCFNFTPNKFKPPQLTSSKSNKKLIKQKMNLDYIPNQLFHKVYHCNDTGKTKNAFIDVF
jgi:predicted deacetylase